MSSGIFLSFDVFRTFSFHSFLYPENFLLLDLDKARRLSSFDLLDISMTFTVSTG